MRGSRRGQRRSGAPTTLELLLGDPGTVYAAVDAFALVERREAVSWPFVASVGPRTVTLRWAGGASAVPEPEAPWRVGHDARVWIAERDEVGVGGPVVSQPVPDSVLVIGHFQESVVFVNASRAPGPIVVGGGSSGAAGLLRELLTRQAQMVRPADLVSGDAPHDGNDVGPRGAWWPVEVEGDAVVLLGLAIARMFSGDEVRLACELMERVAGLEHRRPPAAVEHDVEQAEQIHQVGQIQQVQPADEQSDLAEYVEKTDAPEPEPEPWQTTAPEPTAESKAIDAGVSGVTAPTSARSADPLRTPAPAEDGLHNWAAEFAVSSRTGTEPSN